MKLLTILFLILIISCSSSSKNATFTGFDSRKCGCCWGYEVTLCNGKKMKAGKFPANLNLTENIVFPFEGEIEYTMDSQCDNVIEITSFVGK